MLRMCTAQRSAACLARALVIAAAAVLAAAAAAAAPAAVAAAAVVHLSRVQEGRGGMPREGRASLRCAIRAT